MEAQRRKEEEEDRKRRELDKAKQVSFSWTLLVFLDCYCYTVGLAHFVSAVNDVLIAPSCLSTTIMASLISKIIILFPLTERNRRET